MFQLKHYRPYSVPSLTRYLVFPLAFLIELDPNSRGKLGGKCLKKGGKVWRIWNLSNIWSKKTILNDILKLRSPPPLEKWWKYTIFQLYLRNFHFMEKILKQNWKKTEKYINNVLTHVSVEQIDFKWVEVMWDKFYYSWCTGCAMRNTNDGTRHCAVECLFSIF